MSREAVIARRFDIQAESQKWECLSDLYHYHIDEIHRAFEVMGCECRVYNNPVEVKGPVSVRG